MGHGSAARERALGMMRQRRRIEDWTATLAVPPAARGVTARLLELTSDGWRLLIAKRWLSAGADPLTSPILLIGRGGLFALEVAAKPAGLDRPGLEALATVAPRRFAAAANAVHALGISPVAIQPLVITPGSAVDESVHGVRVLGEFALHGVLLTLPKRLEESEVGLVHRRLIETTPAYASLDIGNLPGDRSPRPEEPEGLFDIAEAEAAMLASSLAAPIERWMTFLDPQQSKLVSRTFNGPARISGPAGTGKTVVGLHRAIHLARRDPRKVLFVTFARNLPAVQRTLARALSPETADRIEFTTLHKLALSILTSRGIPAHLEGARAKDLAARAWRSVGQQALESVVANPSYWLEEIDYVIKGRMILDAAGYRLAERRGRRMPLRAQDRTAVWRMYEHYEQLRAAEGINDFNDVLALALAEVSERPLDPPYAAVIVDEVQDLTLTGIRLLHTLAGDGPNGLLLIGDGQQAVYPGGYRLSEAGITVAGARGVTLTTNYRNRAEILDAALKVVSEYAFEDIDESTVSGNRAVQTTMRGGVVTNLESPTLIEHDNLLIEAIRQTMDETPEASLGDVALLCPSVSEAERYRRALHKAGLRSVSLEAYDGSRSEACKIGTYTRVKGLDFKHVFIPRQELAVPRTTQSDGADRERRELAVRRLYVAMTRARDSLWIGSVRTASAT